MKLFDKISDDNKEEVEIASKSQEDRENESRLKQEVEQEVTSSVSEDSSSTSSSSSNSSSSSMLPGMSSETSHSGSSKNVDLEDVHKQNKKIIGLLEDIKSEVKGGNDELL